MINAVSWYKLELVRLVIIRRILLVKCCWNLVQGKSEEKFTLLILKGSIWLNDPLSTRKFDCF